MGKKENPSFLDYLNAVKKADREREIAQHGKLISTRPLRIVKSKKVYNRKREKKRGYSTYNDDLFFYLAIYLAGQIIIETPIQRFTNYAQTPTSPR
mgnify:CR=1 FL=1